MKGIDNEILLFRVQGALRYRVKTPQRHKCQKFREGRLLLEGSGFRSRRRLIIKLARRIPLRHSSNEVGVSNQRIGETFCPSGSFPKANEGLVRNYFPPDFLTSDQKT